jgi:PhoPQ-activated pathogenicity-related protein
MGGFGVSVRSFHGPAKRRVAMDRGRPLSFHPLLEVLEKRCLLSAVSAAPQLFYDNSRWDNNTPGFNAADDAAIATDKTAYLPNSGLSTFANVSSYTRGINGVVLDLTGAHGTITPNDFTFRVGNNNAPATWATVAQTPALTVRGGAGPGGADRIELLWPDGAIQKQWLQVIVAANANTGLPNSYMFFFGSAVADSGAGNSSNYLVNAIDEQSARNDPHSNANLAAINDVNDFNRDRLVNTTDQVFVRNNGTNNANALRFDNITVTAPSLSAALSVDTGPDGVPNGDGVTTNAQINGTLSDAYSVTSFKAGINGGPITTDCLSLLQPNGTFTLSPALLATMNGGSLPDGPYTVALQSLDAQGQSTMGHVSFVKKTTIATPAAPDLVDASDLGTSQVDNLTSDNTPTFAISAESGALVRMYVDNISVGQGTAAPGLLLTTPSLTDGVHQIKVIAQDGAGNSATSANLAVTISTSLPSLTLATMTDFTDDLTPHVTVTASDALGLPNGTQLSLDVDLNNDGDFADAGELGRTQATLYNGSAYFQLTPALPANLLGSPYTVKLRARLTDTAGNEGTSALSPLRIDTTGNSVLQSYVNTVDPTYAYSLNSTLVGAGYKDYIYDLKSQTWRSLTDVTTPLWQHWLHIIVPQGDLAHLSTTALLLIDGGSNSATAPTTSSSTLTAMAVALNTVVIDLPTVPNEPLVLGGVSRSEDAIIAYSFNQYTSNLGGVGNETWPALLPMVKSAVRAMDTVQAVDTGIMGGTNINDFVVTGYSKRGWTTWLTAAVDNRVKAIVPGVIDVLNMDEQLMHHHAFYSDSPAGPTFVDGFSITLQDYVGYGIPESVQTALGQELGKVVDPYKYLSNGHFNIPKLAINSSGDEFFAPDSSQFYFSDLPGTQNYLRYLPNTGHGLDGRAGDSTLTFYNAVTKNLPLPQYSWSVQPDGSIRVQTSSSPTQVLMWQATNPTHRDFRHAFNPSVVYTSSALTDQGGGVYVASVPTPASGATAFFVELTFTSPISGDPYVFTTEIKVASNIPLAAWPFYTDTSAGAAVVQAIAAADLNPLAVALSAPGATGSTSASDRGASLLVPAASAPATPVASASTWEDENLDLVDLLADDADQTNMADELNAVAVDTALDELDADALA